MRSCGNILSRGSMYGSEGMASVYVSECDAESFFLY
jgi:hypothetical protein